MTDKPNIPLLDKGLDIETLVKTLELLHSLAHLERWLQDREVPDADKRPFDYGCEYRAFDFARHILSVELEKMPAVYVAICERHGRHDDA